MTPWQILVLLFIAGIFGLIGWLIGCPKGRPGWGFWLAFFFSLLGIIIVAIVPASEEGRVRQATAKLRAEHEAQRSLTPNRRG